jgi:signal transduction histidine kinase
MPLFTFDALTALRMLAFVYMLMSLAMWVLFKRLNTGRGSLSWARATALAAVGTLLFSVRGVAPDWATVWVANLVVFSAYGLAVVSLRSEVGLKPGRRRATLAVLAASMVFIGADFVSTPLRMKIGISCHALGAAILAWTGLQAARATPMRSVRLIGGAYMIYAVALALVALGRIASGASTDLFASGTPTGLFAALLTGTAAGVYGTLGYIGMAMERLRENDIAQATALAREGAQRTAAEENAQQLQRWLNERDNLIRVLAHEVRQPLNNASAALQSARAALVPAEEERRAQPAAVEHRVQRAQSVLNQVVGSLDNTLAATALLASPDRVAQQDTDVDLLVQLCLGDLDMTQLHRVQVQRHSGVRTASMDAGLMRLALRNLLSNALAYSNPGSTVLLRLSDSDEPLALVFEVIDHGPGVDPELRPRLFQRGERGQHEQPGHGLGLYVVLRVAELHDSTVTMEHREGGGSIFRFVLIQGVH